jgi:hypothetical protein
MTIGVLKLLDKGIHPLLDVYGHGIYQRLLLHLLHHQLRQAGPSSNWKKATDR